MKNGVDKIKSNVLSFSLAGGNIELSSTSDRSFSL